MPVQRCFYQQLADKPEGCSRVADGEYEVVDLNGFRKTVPLCPGCRGWLEAQVERGLRRSVRRVKKRGTGK